MKVVLSFPGCHRRGGVERIMLECARYLVTRGHDVHVLCSEWDPQPVDDVTRAVKVHRVPQRRRPGFLSGWAYYHEAGRRLARMSYDVLNTHGCVCPTGGVMWAQSIHRVWLERSREMRPAWSGARLKQRLNPLHPVLLSLESKHFLDRAYQHVIATTPDVRDDLARLYRVPAADVTVVPNGFNPEEFNPERRRARRAVARERLGLGRDQPTLLFVANELERKGYRTLLAALRRLNRADLRVLLVGRTDAATANQMAAEAGVGHNILHCGATADVSEYHAAADVFVLPTQYEAFCLAILEALGSGLPVVTTTVPGARDAIRPGINGAAISDPHSDEQLSDALANVLEPGTLARLTESAPGSVLQYQWPAVLRQYERVLEKWSRASAHGENLKATAGVPVAGREI
jgi:UDP-glucose:(heptosyl)LPS alpha-1,3-glucosyltransferase